LRRRGWRAAVAVSLVTFLSLPAMADEPKPATDGEPGKVEDPLEDVNRFTSGFNSIVRGPFSIPWSTATGR